MWVNRTCPSGSTKSTSPRSTTVFLPSVVELAVFQHCSSSRTQAPESLPSNFSRNSSELSCSVILSMANPHSPSHAPCHSAKVPEPTSYRPTAALACRKACPNSGRWARSDYTGVLDTAEPVPLKWQIVLLAALALFAYFPARNIPLIADDYPNISQALVYGAPSGLGTMLHDAQFRLRSTSYW